MENKNTINRTIKFEIDSVIGLNKITLDFLLKQLQKEVAIIKNIYSNAKYDWIFQQQGCKELNTERKKEIMNQLYQSKSEQGIGYQLSVNNCHSFNKDALSNMVGTLLNTGNVTAAGQDVSNYYKNYKGDIKRLLQLRPTYKLDCPIDISSTNMVLEKVEDTYILYTSLLSRNYMQFNLLVDEENKRKKNNYNKNISKYNEDLQKGKDVKKPKEPQYISNIDKKRFEFIISAFTGDQISSINKIISGEYALKTSKICYDEKNHIWNMHFSVEMKKEKVELDENIIVGVDLGMAIPAMCALNNNDNIRQSLGSYDDFTHVRLQLQNQRKRLQESLAYTNSGGHGRSKKLKSLNRFKNKESNFVKTYNHTISKKVIEFALENKAKTIKIEDLSSFNKKEYKNKTRKKLLRNWSYFQLQQFITYKAEKYNIEVIKINPKYTSQTCSKCGYKDKNNRPKGNKGQAYFKCGECGYEENADFNAAVNIARSTDYKK